MGHKYDPRKHHRRSIRLKRYDYSQEGAYFITICTRHMTCLFGRVENDELILNDAGRMIDAQWLALANRFPHIEFGEFITMPNHFHAILIIAPQRTGVETSLVDAQCAELREEGQAQGRPVRMDAHSGHRRPTVGIMVGAFKSITTNEYIKGVRNLNWPRFDGKLWHRNYYEHIIRNEASHLHISEYIRTNAKKWKDDTYSTQNS